LLLLLGGFPYWLVNIPNLKLRRVNGPYCDAVDRYWDWIIPQLAKYQYQLVDTAAGTNYKTGIINFQIADDTDSHLISYDEIHAYYSWLLAGLRKRGINTIVNSLADPSYHDIHGAAIPGVWVALEFAVNFLPTKLYYWFYYYMMGKNSEFPFMNMELYPGWSDCEGQPHKDNQINSTVLLPALHDQFALGGSLSFYMAAGGTNFGFSNGADVIVHYCAIPTSYDYDTMILENGDAHPTKYKGVHDIFSQYLTTTVPPLPATPKPSPKGQYKAVVFNESAGLFDNWSSKKHNSPNLALFNSSHSNFAQSFEQLNNPYGYVTYITTLNYPLQNNTQYKLVFEHIQDRGLVYLNNVFQGSVGWAKGWLSGMSVTLTVGGAVLNNAELKIVVENKGRCSGEAIDFSRAQKGIMGDIWLDDILIPGLSWAQYLMPLDNIDALKGLLQWRAAGTMNPSQYPAAQPTFYRGYFYVAQPLHVYIDTDNFHHGVVFINNFNIGRIYSSVGPQHALYIPAEQLIANSYNEVIVFESDQDLILLKSPFEMKKAKNFKSMPFVPNAIWS
jgi:beta-galactosidase